MVSKKVVPNSIWRLNGAYPAYIDPAETCQKGINPLRNGSRYVLINTLCKSGCGENNGMVICALTLIKLYVI